MKRILSRLFPALIALHVSPESKAQPEPPVPDIVVYGDSSGAVIAAIAAKREGRSVIGVNSTGFPGGMSSSGLGATEAMPPKAARWFRKSVFYDAMAAAYGTNCIRTFEPHVGRQVFEKMRLVN